MSVSSTSETADRGWSVPHSQTKQNGKDCYVLAVLLLAKLIIKLIVTHTFYANIENIFDNG